MYQADIDAVKTRLRGLWGAGDEQPRSERTAQGVEEMLLFPTYAYRDERLKVWRVQVRGWGFSRDASTRRVRWAATLMRRFIGIPAGGDSDQLLLDRVSYLFAGAPASDMARVAMAGIAEPAAFELHAHRRQASGADKGEPAQRRRRGSRSDAVNLLDAPLVLTSQFAQNRGQHAGHAHDRLVRQDAAAEPTIVQKALQIDAFAWQALALEDGQFSGEILVGFNELEWLRQSYAGGGDRRLIELRGKLAGWAGAEVCGVAHLVEPQGVSVVSDIDDTIKASNITAEKRILLETVFARPLEPVPGMAALYRRWYAQGAEFHYVSNSPWQLYPALDGFFRHARFPPGSAHLRAFDPNDLLSVSNYTGTPQLKRDTIESLFATFPQRRFVLVGDCGEQDLETYTDLARRFPGRVLRIFVRDLFAPLRVPAVTTMTDVAGNNVNPGGIPYGIVGAREQAPRRQRSSSGGSASRARHAEPAATDSDPGPRPPKPARHAAGDLISFDDARPPLPPKPANLRGPPINPSPSSSQSSRPPINPSSRPPKPPRTGSSPHRIQTPAPIPTHLAQAGVSQSHPPQLQHAPTQSQQPQFPGGWTPTQAQQLTSAEQLQLHARQLRQQAQQWLAFYAQQFYVAPTRSFLRHARSFLPQVQGNLRIIDYDAISTAAPDAAAAQAALLPEIPEPPPPEAQLARNERRLLLWKRFLACTRGLPADMCRLFVDADDIGHDAALQAMFPRHPSPAK